MSSSESCTTCGTRGQFGELDEEMDGELCLNKIRDHGQSGGKVLIQNCMLRCCSLSLIEIQNCILRCCSLSLIGIFYIRIPWEHDCFM